jgi:hypothetical protein
MAYRFSATFWRVFRCSITGTDFQRGRQNPAVFIMEACMHFIARIACLTLALAFPAQAQDAPAKQEQRDRVEIDTKLFCDTPQQVERFVSLLDENKGSAEASIAGVNREAKTQDACVIATAAFRRAGVTATVKNHEATFDVTRIVVIGVYTVNGLERSLPTEFFTLVPRQAEDGTVGQGGQ